MANIDDDDIEVESFDDEDLSDGFGEELITDDPSDLEDSLEDSDDLIDDDAVDVDVVDDAVDVDAVLAPVEKVAVDLDEDPEIELDVELALDEIVLIPSRFAEADDTEDDEDTTPSPATTEIIDAPLPRQPDEFRCSSCHLLKNVSQLADKNKALCRDCI